VSEPAIIYFAVILIVTAVGMVCNTVAWAVEKKRTDR
jgi:hypothetical protein